MDFSPLTDALASKSYEKIADICDDLMLRVAAQGVAFQDEWPYVIHLLGHIYINDINSARFLWKSIPSAIKDSRPEVSCSMEDRPEAMDMGLWWELYNKRMFQLLLSAYSTISVQDTALFLGMNEDDATYYVQQQGWILDPASRMLTVKKQPIVTEQKLDPSKLQRLTEYVFHLEH
ncbi:COP9 signalosome complex subunit 8 [Melia azedarach]|uniref:COP9 signalosome complex subunit 8 n=1 Tax=Melia azedarach TaxID=155640 RepID=A0ACC1Y213_MELAZ|nr:COP9 signalosome complex subunit 8 [Melia azedarach]